MGKRIAITLVVAIVLGGGLWALLSNAHVGIFPCEKTSYDFQTKRKVGPKSAMCSLLDIRHNSTGEDKSHLTVVGYLVEGVVVGVIPLVIGFLVGTALTRKKAGA